MSESLWARDVSRFEALGQIHRPASKHGAVQLPKVGGAAALPSSSCATGTSTEEASRTMAADVGPLIGSPASLPAARMPAQEDAGIVFQALVGAVA